MYQKPPASTSRPSYKTFTGVAILSMRKTIINSTAVPSEAARLPNTENMVKKNEDNNMSRPIKKTLVFTIPVSKVIKKVNSMQYNMPLRLCSTGPGPSAILTQKAPVLIIMPRSILPNCEKITAGKIISSVTLIPSARYWLNKKYCMC